MKLNDFITFIERKGFKRNTRDGSYEKKVNELDKRYVFKDNMVFMENKPYMHKTYKLVAYADIREVFITQNDKLGGFNRNVATRS